MNPLTRKATHNVKANETLDRDNLIISIGCGVVLAVLSVSFFL
jgi:hypothetical protein